MKKIVEKNINNLAVYLEEIGIITRSEVPSFWSDILFRVILDETRSIVFRIADYLKNLSTLTEEERAEAEDDLIELLKLVKIVLSNLDNEQGLTEFDVLFKGKIKEMEIIMDAFTQGRGGGENPAKYINKAYQSGSDYRNVEQAGFIVSNDE